MKKSNRNSKLIGGISSSYQYVQKFVLKYIAPYLVPALVIYAIVHFFSIPLNKIFFTILGSTVLWAAYALVVIFLAIRIKGQADMQKTQQKLKGLSGRRVASEIEAFIQEALPIVFDVVVKLGFAVGLLYLHLLNEKRKWVAYSDRLIIILLIVIGTLLLLIYFSIAFYVSKIDVEVVRNAKEKGVKKNAVESSEEKAPEEKMATEQVKRPSCGYHPYFDPKLEGSINYGLKPDDDKWTDFATSPFNLHPSNPHRNPNEAIPKPMQEFMNKYANGEIKGLSEEATKPRETDRIQPVKEEIKPIIDANKEETSEKKIGEQPNRFSDNLNINQDFLKKVLAEKQKAS